MTERDALFAAVCERPWDDVPRLVFADYLDDHGRPERAEYVRLQCEAARHDRGSARHRELTERAYHVRRAAGGWPDDLPALPWVTWGGMHVRGFVGETEVSPADKFPGVAGLLFAAAPVTRLVVREVRRRNLVRVLATPEIARVEELRLVGQPAGVWLMVAECPLLTRLRAVDLPGVRPSEDHVRPLLDSPHLPRLRFIRASGTPVGWANNVLAGRPTGD